MKKILIAEDDFFIRDVYSKTFSLNGYEVHAVADGQEASLKIKEQAYDMILLDIMMPKITGIDLLVETRTLETPNKSTPIFMITNLGQQSIIEEVFKMGMDGYIIKSQFSPQQIVNEINKFLTDKGNTPPG